MADSGTHNLSLAKIHDDVALLARRLAADVDGVDPQKLERALANITVEYPKDISHGDIAINAAMVLAGVVRNKPRVLAEQLVPLLEAALRERGAEARCEIAGPGFINVHIADFSHHIVAAILQSSSEYGVQRSHHQRSYLLEFVSANPTGPLHVGHGRGAVEGDCLARILHATGHKVFKEYYVNDAGRQIDILVVSALWRRCDETQGSPPQGCYQGDYVAELLEAGLPEQELALVGAALSAQETQETIDDSDALVDALIALAKQHPTVWEAARSRVLEVMQGSIAEDLAELGVEFDGWYYESRVLEPNVDTGETPLAEALKTLAANGHSYEQDGAVWFRSTDFGDDKDRVLVRSNGVPTYFATDIAYHWDKWRRQPDELITVLGADHHGYVQRIKGACAALGHPAEQMHTRLVQLANIQDSSGVLAMSTRAGSFVTLHDLVEATSLDAVRFTYALQSCDQGMTFDVDKVREKTRDNPVYYVQYAHARICSLLDRVKLDPDIASASREYSDTERELVKLLARWPLVLGQAAARFEVHKVAHYLWSLAQLLHSFYNAYPVAGESDPAVQQRRACTHLAVRKVLRYGLSVLGVSQPASM